MCSFRMAPGLRAIRKLVGQKSWFWEVTTKRGFETDRVQPRGFWSRLILTPMPGSVQGLNQVNATVPAVATSGAQPVVVPIGGVASHSGVTVSVQ